MMIKAYVPVLLYLLLASASSTVVTAADKTSPAERRQRAMEFHFRAQERTGILVPLYVYPADVHTNKTYNRLIDIKRRYETVPIWVIVNPASGPGTDVDANYTKAIDRLQGAGCVVLGYVSTSYGKRKSLEVTHDIDRWLTMYPRIQGIFFDEMIYDDTEVAAAYQTDLNRYAHD
ncbi:MAG: spherulation-specific family 4 protein, partial [Planctomycetaceae bacterium]